MWLDPLRMFFLTRPLTFAAAALFRLSPLLGACAWHLAGSRPPTAAWWIAAWVGSALLIVLMAVVERRCGTRDRSFHGGMLVIAASSSSRWIVPDLLLVPASLVFAQAFACLLALGEDPPQEFQQLVHAFYRHRLTS
ncbi:MAG TPA: hypothetical protein VFR91_03875 [Dyella sp.]|nr:hypothetical protein [Dyella sp.]